MQDMHAREGIIKHVLDDRKNPTTLDVRFNDGTRELVTVPARLATKVLESVCVYEIGPAGERLFIQKTGDSYYWDTQGIKSATPLLLEKEKPNKYGAPNVF